MTGMPGGRGPTARDESLSGAPNSGPVVRRQEVADRLAAFRQRTAGRGGSSATESLADARAERLRALAGAGTGLGPDA